MFDESKHTREPKGVPEGGQFVARANNEQDIINYVNMVLNGEEAPRKIIVGDIEDRERLAIEKLTGDKLNAVYHTLSENEVRHIEKRHGTNGKADTSMSEIESYGKIIDVIRNFDAVELVERDGKIQTASKYVNKYGEKAKLVAFKKSLTNTDMIVVEAITDTKRGDILIMSARQIKK